MPELFCPVCNRENLVIATAVYDGFKRTGEQTACANCGHVFAASEIKPVERKKPVIFSDDDRPAPIKLFEEGENRVICRYCTHYIVNPFKQMCGLHRREVEATDTCDQFSARGDKKEESNP